MVYHKCTDCGEEDYYECYDKEPQVVRIETDEKWRLLRDRIKTKIMDLQDQIITSYTDKTSAIADNPNDRLRYTAMIDVLRAMLT